MNMKKNNINETITVLEGSVINLLKQNAELSQNIIHSEQKFNDQLKKVALELISIIDSFEIKYENYKEMFDNGKIKEAELKVADSYQSISRKIIRILESYDVSEINFNNNMAIMGYCKVVETKPDSTKEDGTILFTLKKGYTLNNKLLRPAEVISVKN